MRRTALHRKRHSDPVSTEDRADVLSRDRGCVLASLEPGHVCRDIFGNAHAPGDLARLTLEHIHMDGSMMGKRAPSTPDSMVALCGLANNRPPSRVQRELMRTYLRGLHA